MKTVTPKKIQHKEFPQLTSTKPIPFLGRGFVLSDVGPWRLIVPVKPLKISDKSFLCVGRNQAEDHISWRLFLKGKRPQLTVELEGPAEEWHGQMVTFPIRVEHMEATSDALELNLHFVVQSPEHRLFYELVFQHIHGKNDS